MFNDRVVVGPQKSFSHTDLLEYVETLLKESKIHEEKNLEKSNYSWLKSRSYAPFYSEELEKLKPILLKMSPESCSVIAVKLDTLTEDVTPSHAILTTFKNLLEQQHIAQIMRERVTLSKGSIRAKKKDRNKVHPELLPPGRQATVSFVLNEL